MIIVKWTITALGEQCLCSLDKEIMGKDGLIYRFIQGPTFAGYIGPEDSESDAQICRPAIQVGHDDNPNHIIIPLSNVLSIQECHKVIKTEGVLVIT